MTMLNSWKTGEERRAILSRTKRGRDAVAKKGGLLGGYTSYGYGYVAKTKDSLATLEVLESQAVVIREIYGWLTEECLSCRAIAYRLSELGIPTATGKKKWAASVVNSMIRNEVYCGIAYFNRREPSKPQKKRNSTTSNQKTSRKLRSEEEWIPIPVPAIIDRDTWEKAQKQLAVNSRFSPRNSKRVYFLTKLMRCGFDGKAYSGVTKERRGKEYSYYICDWKSREPGEVKCESKYVPMADLDELVWDSITSIIQNPANLIEELRSRQANDGVEWYESERNKLTKELNRLDGVAGRLLDLYADGRYSRENLDEKIDEVKGRKQIIKNRLAGFEAIAEEVSYREQYLGNLEDFCIEIRRGIEELTFDERQKVLRLLVDSVKITGNNICIEMMVPPSDPDPVSRLRPKHPPPSTPGTRSVI